MNLSKHVLEELIYNINAASPFLIKTAGWSAPVVGFSFDKSLNPKFMAALMKARFSDERDSEIICILGDWESVAEGIVFSRSRLIVNSPKNEFKQFAVKYSDISALKFYASCNELRIVSESDEYFITHPFWNIQNINLFLQLATGFGELEDSELTLIDSIMRSCPKYSPVPSLISGIVYGDVSSASTLYGMDKFSTPRGHGFAAERANHLYDKITNLDFFGRDKVQMVGEELDPNTGRIVKNGADRIVNGINIQTKYCRSGAACVSECFENNRFRYFNPDGSPMQIEVPSDMYSSAVQAMEHRIRQGQVPGVSDPKEAANIIRKGHYTYAQARNIAKAGNIDSIRFDASNGAIIALSSLGVSAVIAFACSVWNGDELHIALKNAGYVGLKVGGTSFISAVFASQLAKAGLNSALVGSSEALVRVMGPKASALLINAFRSGNNIYGAAAMKSAAKLLRGNIITGGVTTLVLSSVDIVNIFRGRISAKQLLKNVVNTGSSVTGGTAGWVGGAALGSMILPGIGTIIGGVAGSLAGAAAAGKASNAVMSTFIEDDAEDMVRIIERAFVVLADDYLLSKSEAENIVEQLGAVLNAKLLKNMFAADDRRAFANDILSEIIEKEVAKRPLVSAPPRLKYSRAYSRFWRSSGHDYLKIMLPLKRLIILWRKPK